MTRHLLSASTLTVTQDGGFLKELVVSAVYSNSFSLLKCIVDKYPELLQCEYRMTYPGGKTDNCSLLHHAAVAGSKEMVEFLVHSGLDVKQRTSEHEGTVLGTAASRAHLSVVDYLLKTNTADDLLSLGADPIVMAGFGGSVEIFNKLVNVGFDPMQKNKHEQTTLHMALGNGKEELAFYIMQRYPALIHMTGQYGRSALHLAAEGCSVTLLSRLIGIPGVDILCVDDDGYTVLQIACVAGKMDVVMYLTEHHKYPLHNKNNSGKTALHLASVGGNVDIFKHLVNDGLDAHEHGQHATLCVSS